MSTYTAPKDSLPTGYYDCVQFTHKMLLLRTPCQKVVNIPDIIPADTCPEDIFLQVIMPSHSLDNGYYAYGQFTYWLSYGHFVYGQFNYWTLCLRTLCLQTVYMQAIMPTDVLSMDSLPNGR